VTASVGTGTTATLSVAGAEIRFGGTPCGAATTANTDTITVSGSAGSVERLVVDQSAGALAPGATAESLGISEIELALNLGDATDEVVLQGTTAADMLSVGTKGVALNNDADLDVTFGVLPSAIELTGGDGADVLTAGGGFGAAQVFLGRVTLRGDGGDDTLSGAGLADLLVGGAGADGVDGGGGNDALHGEAGIDRLNGQDGNDTLVGGSGADSLSGGSADDTLVAFDGEIDTLIHGQLGIDTAYFDAGVDPAPISIENAVPGPPPLFSAWFTLPS
jgi:Ca2+-binding RTX toxin-like protein